MNFGNAIKSIRKSKDIKQKELAELLGVQSTYLCAIEKGRKEPSIKLVKAVASALGCSVELIFWNAIEPPKDASYIEKKSYRIAREIILKYCYIKEVDT